MRNIMYIKSEVTTHASTIQHCLQHNIENKLTTHFIKYEMESIMANCLQCDLVIIDSLIKKYRI